ncbi:DUF3179 domain-containing protein [Primorskyibacter sp. S87]|uniref:DUF3179 domain-containing protein n=1 Tax=Primorskyibacter sp. S87 TaxID=3415126 RepID=UPI003C7CE9C1
MLARVFLFAFLLAGAVQADPAKWRVEWPETNFAQSAVADWSEIRSGGPPRDGIPAIDAPRFLPASAENRIGEREPVITIELKGGRPRAYPIRYLIWHEIVNDEVSGIPVAVTFCPLCNSALVFDRRTPKGTLSFGVSGKLRHSDMVMFDRQTESWWQQATATAIVGDLTGTTLVALPGWMESWADYRGRNPDGLVMDEPDFNRAYGRNPYRGYDSARQPFLYDGALPPNGVPPLMRVVRVGNRAWTLERLREAGTVTEAGVTINWQPGQASALDAGRIARGRDVGSIRVQDGQGRDLPHDVMFAFAFHAFWPDGVWMHSE